MAETPSYIEYGEGYANITLSRPAEIDGTKVAALRMREPTVEDQLAQEAAKGSDGEKEIATFANLTENAPASIRKLPLKDYKRLQVAYMGFID